MPNVKKYKAIVKQVINPLEGVYTVTFISNKRFIYKPGQFLHLALDDYDGVGQWPQSRCFSMQSNPEEKEIKITFSVKGEFTNRMKNELSEGKEVWLKLPYGDLFDRGHDKSNCVFIAGGTGITPFLSLFNHHSFFTYPNPKIYLGFKSEVFNIYNDELSKIKNENANIKVYYEYKDGILNIESIFEDNGIKGNYFISGPPNMIKSFKNCLVEKRTNFHNIFTDDWE